ncbi:low molecular weight protein-tyrosine-phosphatase [Paraburkholderia sp. GAS32]|uniref:low molecular weight protein-tyrosine-phosphatase n=1 Tax=Paraburkholderia sp. GAS32 TaxID=3035129 RepID=UPI003D1A26F1
MIDTILIVCEGNICRSPMARGLLAKELPRARITSAGLGALVGRQADPLAIELMAEREIDISGHVASALSLQDVRAAQLVLTMTLEQRRRIEANYSFVKGKVYRLGEHEGLDVLDPYRRGRAAFEMSLVQIERSLSRWLEAMIPLVH